MNNSTPNQWMAGNGGLLKADLKHPSGARGVIYRHGAHLTKWQSSAGNDWIFTSECAKFGAGSAIRGGVPIIFPQFNEIGKGPRHGFARNVEWQTADQDGNRLILVLESGEDTQVWPHQFRAELECRIDALSLKMALSITNTSTKSFEFTCAFHTYFRIHSLETCAVDGLTGLSYWDNDGSDFNQRHSFEAQQLKVGDAFDRVFFNYQQPLVLHSKQSQLKIEHSGFKDIVVWNPGREATEKMDDLADYEYKQMLCIEAAQIDKPVQLHPGETWLGTQYCTDLDCA